jgi:glycosyltransferase involved in cell wall biosynthesis
MNELWPVSSRNRSNICVLAYCVSPYLAARLESLIPYANISVLELCKQDDVNIWARHAVHEGIQLRSIYPDSASYRRDGRLSKTVGSAMAELKPDVVVIPGWGERGSLVCLRWCMDNGIPTVLMSESQETDMRRFIPRELIKSVIVACFDSGFVAGIPHRRYLEKLGMPRDRIFAPCSIVDNVFFARGAQRVRDQGGYFRNLLGLPSRYILASSRFIRRKNIRLLLEAYRMYRLKRGSDAYNLVLLGDGHLRGHIRGFLRTYNLANVVHLPGLVEYSRLPEYYALASVFVHAAYSEQWGLVVNEAMASGLPVIVSRSCGCATDLVAEGQNGYTFNPLMKQELANLFELVTNDKHNLEKMGRESAEIIGKYGQMAFSSGLMSAASLAMERKGYIRKGARTWLVSLVSRAIEERQDEFIGRDAKAISESAIRATIQQPALPKYRIPFFRKLSLASRISLKVVYGIRRGIPNVPCEGFHGEYVPLYECSVMGEHFLWHSAQWKAVKRSFSDVAVLSWDAHYLTLFPSLIRARITGIPVILWGHGFSKRHGSFRGLVRRAAARMANALVFYEYNTARSFAEDGWPPEKLFVAQNTIDREEILRAIDRWNSRKEELDKFREAHQLTAGRVILFVSRLEADNRVDMLIRASEQLSDAYPDLRIVIIGAGPEDASLRKMALECGVDDKVSFVGPIYDEEQLAPWFLSSSVFCYPNNAGLSIMHAFAYGLPVVTTEEKELQNPEIYAVEHGVNGLTYSHDSLTGLVSALERLLANSDYRIRLAGGALQASTAIYTLDHMVNGMADAIVNALEGGA